MGTSDDQEDTPLHEAVRFSDEEDTHAALKAGHDPNQIGLYQWSPLHEAARIGDLPILELLLKFGGDPNKADLLHACTALHYAAAEGHVTCLHALLDAGARWDLPNQSGKTSLDVATRKCIPVLEKLSESKLISESSSRETLEEGTLSGTRSPSSTLGSDADTVKSDTKTGNEYAFDPDEISLASVDSLGPSHSPSTGSSRWSPQSWNSDGPVLGVSRRLVLGQIQLSFEYNSKKATLKIRIWQLTDLLLPPVETSMISGIYVKSYLLPDKRKDSKRKTDEQQVHKQSEKPQKKMDVTSRSVILKPASFQFTKCPEYKKVTREMVCERTVHLEVCILQKYTRRSFVLATWNMPLAEAVKRLVKESYPLTPRISTELPENMKVYDGSQLTKTYTVRPYSSHPNIRAPSVSSLQRILHSNSHDRAVSDTDLKSVAVVDAGIKKMTSVEISVPDDDVQDELAHALQEITIMGRAERDQWTSVPIVDDRDMNRGRTTVHDEHVTVHMPYDGTTNKEVSSQSYNNSVFDSKTTTSSADDAPHSIDSTKRKRKFSLNKLRERSFADSDNKEKVKKATKKPFKEEVFSRSISPSWQWDNYMEPFQMAGDPVTFDDDFGFELDGPYLPMGTTLDMPRVHGNSFSRDTGSQAESTIPSASTSFMTNSKLPHVVISPPADEKRQSLGSSMPRTGSTSIAIPPACCMVPQPIADGATSAVVIPEMATVHVEDDSSVARTPRRGKQRVRSRSPQTSPVKTSGWGSKTIPTEVALECRPRSGIELASYPMKGVVSAHMMKPSRRDLGHGTHIHKEADDIETILM